ncbi:MAG: hypothetical protein AAGE52_26760 [Myxococcota bacterium]
MRHLSFVFLIGACSSPPVLWEVDGGTTATDSGSADATSDGEVDGSTPVPCDSYRYATERFGEVRDLAIVGGVDWLLEGNADVVRRIEDGRMESVAVPNGGQATELLGGNGPWLRVRQGDSYSLHRWSGSEWVELPPLPASTPIEAGHEVHTARLAVHGDWIFVTYQNGREVFVYRDDCWEEIYASDHLKVAISASEDVVALTYAEDGIYRHVARFGGSWRSLPSPGSNTYNPAFALRGHVVLQDGLYDGTALREVPELAGMEVVEAETVRGRHWVAFREPFSPSAPLAGRSLLAIGDALERGLQYAVPDGVLAFPDGDLPTVAQHALEWFDGTDWQQSQVLSPDAIFRAEPVAVVGNAEDYWVVDRRVLGTRLLARAHRVRGSQVEHLDVAQGPESPAVWDATVTSAAVEPGGTLWLAARGRTPEDSLWVAEVVAVQAGRVVERFTVPTTGQRHYLAIDAEARWVVEGKDVYEIRDGELQHVHRADEMIRNVRVERGVLYGLDVVCNVFRADRTELVYLPELGTGNLCSDHQRIHVSGERVWISGVRGVLQDAADENQGLAVWNGTEWRRENVEAGPIRIVGRGDEVVAFDSTFRRWTYEDETWVRQDSCALSSVGGSGFVGFWPGGAREPWFFAPGNTLLRANEL